MEGCRRLPKAAAAVTAGALLFFLGCSKTSAEDERLLERSCGTCHTTKTVFSKGRSLEEWRRMVKVMRTQGAEINDEEEKRIAEYLYAVSPDK